MSGIPWVGLDEDSGMKAVCATWKEIASLVLFVGPEPVGSLRWELETGVVTMIEVYPAHRRKGYGTALWQGAQWLCKEHGWLPVEHGPLAERSEDAKAWIASLGDDSM